MILLLSTLLLALPMPTSAAATQGETVPANDGWVTDLAGVLNPGEEAALEALMESYRSGTSHEIALLTVPSLDGRTIEGLSLAVAREWGLGQKGENNGALFVVARDDREMRIEVGRGLEGTLTDAIAGRIIRDVVAPEFRRGQGYYPGIRAGVEAMHAAIGGDYGPIRQSRGGRRSSAGYTGCAAIVVNLFMFVIFMGVARRRRGVGGSVLPWLLLSSMVGGRSHGGSSGGFGAGGFGGFGGGGGFSGGGSSGGW